MKKIIGYIQGFAFFERIHSNFCYYKWHINVVSVHPKWSITWHWLISWTAPWSDYKDFRWWSLGFRFAFQKLMPRKEASTHD